MLPDAQTASPHIQAGQASREERFGTFHSDPTSVPLPRGPGRFSLNLASEAASSHTCFHSLAHVSQTRPSFLKHIL